MASSFGASAATAFQQHLKPHTESAGGAPVGVVRQVAVVVPVPAGPAAKLLAVDQVRLLARDALQILARVRQPRVRVDVLHACTATVAGLV